MQPCLQQLSTPDYFSWIREDNSLVLYAVFMTMLSKIADGYTAKYI